eukprot:CAMPEP_0114578328 /NCGR_PEP_ID=MMETSP0125-20121206/2883_1 /TAXON_ID=485358 ORGANISM="Aristerostoma sp., Strain ATCC 50986" /NCGR_SAMPLE_ID=MMETSP0125 /ASSEMBLY_ACC=CAM_ASM_000245 /LENGTH=63 /DNA_ID=CAMNT_0001768319 /DNA_START=415 /DNA_END=603 /DNA_ORIENTATION=+
MEDYDLFLDNLHEQNTIEEIRIVLDKDYMFHPQESAEYTVEEKRAKPDGTVETVNVQYKKEIT